MADSIFRKKSLDHVSSPDKIDDYMKVTSIKLWIILLAIFLLFVAFIAWAIFGKIKNEEVDEKGKIVVEEIAPISLF